MNGQQTYDYAIIGAGVAGLNLARAMKEHKYFRNDRILLLDGGPGAEKTLCFWEEGKGLWDAVLAHSWENGSFISSAQSTELEMGDYQYKMLTSSKLREYSKSILSTDSRFSWIEDELIELHEKKDAVDLKGANGTYRVKHVFDSRIELNKAWQAKSIGLKQHFLGWEIELAESEGEAPWKTEAFTMMDFRIKWKDSTSFTYVLPFSEKRALVEFTLFNHDLLSPAEYEDHLKRYIKEILQIDDYTILRTETGVIPMTTYPFHRHHSKRLTKIGSAGGWIKPSTGYSFRNSMALSKAIVENISAGKRPEKGIARGRHRFYDRLLLDLLDRNNHWGERLFDTMYRKNGAQRIFRFLDEESSFSEDLKVMASFNPFPFIAAVLRSFKK